MLERHNNPFLDPDCRSLLRGGADRRFAPAGYVTVDAAQLNKGLRERHGVSTGQRAALTIRLADPDTLDAGERDLLAHALGRADDWLASCADRAAVNAALELGLEERFVSLGALARAAGARPALKYHFTDPWLSEVRTAFLLEQLAK